MVMKRRRINRMLNTLDDEGNITETMVGIK